MAIRIDDNNRQFNNPYSSGIKRVTQESAGDFPSYLLGDDDGVVWEREQEQRDKKTQKKSEQGVVYERSSDTTSIGEVNKVDGKDASKELQKDYVAPKATISGVLNQIFSGFRKLFEFIWYGEGGKEGSTASAKTATLGEKGNKPTNNDNSELSNNRILKIDKGLQEEKPIAIVMNEERLKEVANKRVARNTSLLTYYDKHGNLITPPGSDSARILHGDKNVRAF